MRLVPVLSHEALFCTLCCFCYTLMIFLICLINLVSFCLAMVLNTHFSAASGPKMFKKLLSKRLFEERRNVYKSRQLSLLQSAMESYFKLGQLLYYKVRWLLKIARVQMQIAFERTLQNNRLYRTWNQVYLNSCLLCKLFSLAIMFRLSVCENNFFAPKEMFTDFYSQRTGT